MKSYLRANVVSERLLREAERTAQSEFNRAITELREELIFGALNRAESKLREKVDVSTQKKLSGEFTQKIQVVQP